MPRAKFSMPDKPMRTPDTALPGWESMVARVFVTARSCEEGKRHRERQINEKR